MKPYMHNASIGVKSKRIYGMVQIARMKFDDRPDTAKRLELARQAAGIENARQAAKRFGWVYETYVQHENGTRGIARAADQYAAAYRVSKAWLLTGEGVGPSASQASQEPDVFDQLNEAELEDVKRHARGLIALRQSSDG